MRMQRWIQHTIPLATIALITAAPVALAQRGRDNNGGSSGSQIFEWSGRVDREVQISMRDNQVWARYIGNNESGRGRSRVVSALPRRDGQVAARIIDGRGSVDVIQQPSAQNGYTTVVRIQDPASGADNYRVAAYWQTYSNDDVNSNRGNGRGRGRDEDRNNDRNRDASDRDRQQGQYNQGGNRTVMHWSGNVDNELEIRIQNGRVDYRTISGAQPTSIRADRGSMNISSNTRLGVVQNQGRGSVTIVQQPSSRNGNTTVIRVRDPQSGYGFYDFDLIMQ